MELKTNTKVVQISENHIIFEVELKDDIGITVSTTSVVMNRKMEYAVLSNLQDDSYRQLKKIIQDKNGAIMRTSKFIFGYKD